MEKDESIIKEAEEEAKRIHNLEVSTTVQPAESNQVPGPKKDNKLPIIILVLLILAIGGFAVWYFVLGGNGKSSSKKEEPKQEEKKEEVIETTITDDMNQKIDRFIKTFQFKYNNITNEEVSNNEKLYYSFYLASNGLQEDYVLKDDVNNTIIELFGKNVKYVDEDIKSLYTDETIATFDGEKYVYNYETAHGVTMVTGYGYEVSRKRSNDIIKVEIKRVYNKCGDICPIVEIYKDPEITEKYDVPEKYCSNEYGEDICNIKGEDFIKENLDIVPTITFEFKLEGDNPVFSRLYVESKQGEKKEEPKEPVEQEPVEQPEEQLEQNPVQEPEVQLEQEQEGEPEPQVETEPVDEVEEISGLILYISEGTSIGWNDEIYFELVSRDPLVVDVTVKGNKQRYNITLNQETKINGIKNKIVFGTYKSDDGDDYIAINFQ